MNQDKPEGISSFCPRGRDRDKTITERVVDGNKMMQAVVKQWTEYWDNSMAWFQVIPVDGSFPFYDSANRRWEKDIHRFRYRIQVCISRYAVLDECIALTEKKVDEERQQRLVATHLS